MARRQPLLPAEEFKQTEAEDELGELIQGAALLTADRMALQKKEKAARELVKATMLNNNLKSFCYDGLTATLEEVEELHITSAKEE